MGDITLFDITVFAVILAVLVVFELIERHDR